MRAQLDKVLTPIGELEMAAVLRDGHHATFGVFPSKERLGVAWAHIAHEHARGKAIWCCNYGNITAGSKWTGDHYVIVCKEQVSPGVWQAIPMHFRAFEATLDGTAAYWDFMRDHEASALPFFDAGDASAAAYELKALGYYTADVKPYALSMKRLYQEFLLSIYPRL